ncbi:MAG TPA: C-terminal helicase domain-containing protein, partial [Prolixibacteraceae bacterium]
VDKVKQYYYHVPNFRTKLNFVSYLLLNEEEFKRVIIFCRTKENAEDVYKVVSRRTEGEVRILHSNKAQSSRINAIEAFKAGGVRVLVSTDVSARGIDVSEISHVINFDLPPRYEDYVHRIGRTARANTEGVAISFIGPEEDFHLENIEKLIRMKIEELPFPDNIDVVPLSRPEKQSIDREIDRQKRLVNPEFKGAFHEKKARQTKSSPYSVNQKSNAVRETKSKGRKKGR